MAIDSGFFDRIKEELYAADSLLENARHDSAKANDEEAPRRNDEEAPRRNWDEAVRRRLFELSEKLREIQSAVDEERK